MGFLNNVIIVFIVLILSVLYFAIGVLINIVAVDIEDEKDEHYQKAHKYLTWAAIITWIIIGLSVIAFAIVIGVSIFFSPEEAGGATAAKEAETGIKEFKGVSKDAIKEAEQLSSDLKKASKSEKEAEKKKNNGLFDLGGVAGNGISGFVVKIIIIGVMVLLLVDGILGAMAAAEIAKTDDQIDYDLTIWIAVLGILPFGLWFVWLIGNFFYVQHQKHEVARRKKKVKEKKKELEEEKKKLLRQLEKTRAARKKAESEREDEKFRQAKELALIKAGKTA